MNEELLIELNKNLEELNKKLSIYGKEVFTAEQAAEYLELSYDTITREARIGRIEHIRYGPKYIFKKEYLDKWLDKNKRV